MRPAQITVFLFATMAAAIRLSVSLCMRFRYLLLNEIRPSGQFRSIGVDVLKHRDGTVIRFNERFKIECLRGNHRATFYREAGVGVVLVSLTSIKVFDLNGNQICVSEEEKEKWNNYVKDGLRYLGIKAEYD
jgi:hypothetical protein